MTQLTPDLFRVQHAAHLPYYSFILRSPTVTRASKPTPGAARAKLRGDTTLVCDQTEAAAMGAITCRSLSRRIVAVITTANASLASVSLTVNVTVTEPALRNQFQTRVAYPALLVPVVRNLLAAAIVKAGTPSSVCHVYLCTSCARHL